MADRGDKKDRTGGAQRRTRRRLPLQLRLVIGLLLISLLPVAVSALLISQIAEVAQNFASNHARELRPPLAEARVALAELIEAKKELFREIAKRVADEAVTAESGEYERVFDAALAASPDLLRVEMIDDAGTVLASRSRPQPARDGLTRYRQRHVEEPLADSRKVVLTFAADLDITEKMQRLRDAETLSLRVSTVRQSLPAGYTLAFLLLVGAVAVIVTAFGIVVARRLSRRIAVLVDGTSRVAEGDLSVRVELRGRDELADLGRTFNAMVAELEADRRKILYLQRIGAWQDVARRLAHEIKNPLTPIQLAVQQLVSSYPGGDDKFAATLHDAEEIVTEEIGSLRRLVDAFRTLGRLPRVEAQPLDLRVVVDDLLLDPAFSDSLEAVSPPQPVMVRGDRLLLRRVLANLVENGIQSTGEGEPGRVVLTWRRDDSGKNAVITVDDQGPGIEPDRRDELFEPYVTSKETGTGLGLPICKKIAFEHKGSLEISDTPAPTGGARLVLTIPIADDEAPTGGA